MQLAIPATAFGLSNFGLLRRTEIAAVKGTEATLCWGAGTRLDAIALKSSC